MKMDNPVLERLLLQANSIILGKPRVIKLALCCLLGKGHLLIEDLPGMGKTTLAHLLARLLGLEFQRVQFTSDLLPADLVGVSIFDRSSEQFRFHPGPVFAQLVLADEINRATPKTQSALLEAMEEQQVTVEGETHPLPKPFFVIATQNPAHQVGTFALPESQLDRFLMRIAIGFPERQQERLLLKGRGGRAQLDELMPLLKPEELALWQQQAEQVFLSDALLDYVQDLVAASRQPGLGGGLSPRAGLSLVQAARAWAWLEGRKQVWPEDVQAVWEAVAAHRLGTSGDMQDGMKLAQTIMHQVGVP